MRDMDFFGAVIDGTPCDNKIFHVCINGNCRHSLITDYYDRKFVFLFHINCSIVYNFNHFIYFYCRL